MKLIPDRNEWFSVDNELPQPIWSKVFAWIRAEVEDKEEEAFWHEFVRDWLQRLAIALGPAHVVDESANFHMLSAASQDVRMDTIQFLESTRKTILSILGERIRPRDKTGKHLVLQFANEGDYYRYVSHHHSEGEHGKSTGAFISRGYMHIATFDAGSTGRLRPILAHELAHNLTSHLPLPLWLSEALAMYFEADITGEAHHRVTRDLVKEHREYWNADTIQGFWKGTSFGSIAGQSVSYNLADTLFRLICTEVRPSPDSLQRFVLAADWDDAAQAATSDYLGIQLSDLAATFLGPGDWSPKPQTWQTPTEKQDAAVTGVPDENGFVWPEGMEPEPESSGAKK